MKARLVAQGFAPGLLLQSGLVAQRESGEIVDRFRNRLMVPICRDAGSVIAFGGRQMDPDQGGPKYLNSPETPIYSKSRTLYGLHLTKPQIRKVGFAVLVEGYFDFAQLFQSDAAPAVASCGTALTSQQAQLLRRFTSKIVLSFDPDAAGQGATVRSCELLVAEGFDVNVVVLDKGEDPDTFIQRNGGEEYRARLRTSRPYLEYLLDQAAKGVDFAHDDSRRQFLGQMLTVAARIPEVTARDQFADRMPTRPDYGRGGSRGNPETGGPPADRGHDPRAAVLGEAETRRNRPDLEFDPQYQGGARRALRARPRRSGGTGRAGHSGSGAKPAKRAGRTLTNGAVAASKYNERPACHEHRRHPHFDGPSRRLRPRHQTAQMGTGAGGTTTRDRPVTGTWRHSTRTRD